MNLRLRIWIWNLVLKILCTNGHMSTKEHTSTLLDLAGNIVRSGETFFGGCNIMIVMVHSAGSHFSEQEEYGLPSDLPCN